ncbi:MAG: hypothetical protein LCI02_07175 [Proteobacteria bacterium]|nr:hypothetical protein [Pseudomonadota bacterium]
MSTHESAAARPLGQKRFTAQDQIEFATASRDWNPMHVDAVAARRLLSGRQVVHGIHTLMHALELWQPPGTSAVASIACSFANPVNVGDPLVFSQRADEGRSLITASVDGLASTEITIDPLSAGAAAKVREPGATLPVRQLGELPAALDEPPGSQIGSVIELPVWQDELAARFPRAAERLGAPALTALAQLSYFVGMLCPGLHSVFSSLVLMPADPAARTLRFEVRRYDPRFHLFIVAFDGAVRGELRAFLRPPPQPQPAMGEVAAQLRGDEFRGVRSLVVGGSRGLGEITAKILAAGGGDVMVSYASGRADAEAVAADINAAGRGRCSVVPLDLQAGFDAGGLDPAALDAVYYFATPRIYSKRTGLFDRTAFDGFVDFYLQRFYALCLWLDGVERERPARVYLPSTVFISERPKGMTEYAMVKAAAEVLADDLNRSLRNVVVVHTRLPRMATDQTASILQSGVAPTLDAMLAVVRQMSSAISSL